MPDTLGFCSREKGKVVGALKPASIVGVLQIGIRAWLQHLACLGSCTSHVRRYCYLHLLLEEKDCRLNL
jgi:hypothetical protein